MRVLTIGRSDDCNIVISDVQNLISRRHALLRFHPFGKMELVPLGQNGTYMNGKLLRNDVPHKVTKRDVVSFAHVKQLDWTAVTNPYRMYYWVSGAILAFFMLLILILCIRPILPPIDFGSDQTTEIPLGEGGGGGVSEQPTDTSATKKAVVPSDTLNTEKKETIKGGTKRYKDNEKQVGKPESKEAGKEPKEETNDANINIIL